jgi:hypothetical protein
MSNGQEIKDIASQLRGLEIRRRSVNQELSRIKSLSRNLVSRLEQVGGRVDTSEGESAPDYRTGEEEASGADTATHESEQDSTPSPNVTPSREPGRPLRRGGLRLPTGPIVIGERVRILNPKPRQANEGRVIKLTEGWVTIEAADGTHIRRIRKNIGRVSYHL